VLLVLSSRMLQNSQLNTEKENRKVSMLTFPNGSDHAMITCYLNYMKEIKSSISMMFGQIPIIYSLLVYNHIIHVMRTRKSMRMRKKIPLIPILMVTLRPFESEPLWLGWMGGPLIYLISPSSYNSKQMQPLHDLRHLETIFQKAQSHISVMLFAACWRLNLGEVEHMQEYGVPEASTDYDLPGWIIDWAALESL